VAVTGRGAAAGGVAAIRGGAVTVAEAAEAFLSSPRAASPNTRRAYAGVIDRLAAELGPHRQLAAVPGDEIAAALRRLWDTSAPATWNRNRAALVSWLTWCASRKRWPVPQLPADAERRKEHADATRALPRARVDRLLSRRDIPLREKTLWRMLYETAARSAEVLALDIGGLDLPSRCAGPPQGRRHRRHRLADRHRAPAAAPAPGPHGGPGIRDRTEGPGAAPRGRPVRARPRPAQLSAGRGAVRQGLRKRDPAPAQALRADARRRDRNRDTDAYEVIRSYLGPVAGQVRASQRRSADAPPGRTRPSAETVTDAPGKSEDICT